MRRYLIEVEVNIDKLIASDPSEGDEQEETIEDHLRRELNWVADSGIYPVNITELA